MPVSIRLSRVGRKDLPFYRIVVIDSRKKRDGKYLEIIGTYDGFKTRLVTFKPDRYDAWIKVGAQPTDTAKKVYRLFKREGVVQSAVVQAQTESVQSRKKVTKKSAEPVKEKETVSAETTTPSEDTKE